MDAKNQQEVIKRAIKERSVRGSLECEVAQEIASELEVEPMKVGEVAKGLNLTLKNCKGKC
ncbi:hypothetical protein [Selenihalanaerobacter shriftii]|uniref:Uncharacterized protein n=1 Tax=Selenihalanaerobacter shriftii TaxID=142842 RepID=A0A1T4PSR5_9FIRM|nr:hypothetical protein [Selenihalanaerobacter shriftii]SJZ94592.1 hypothetical protein SAMN02745118_02296 [Selenihalanaerobacter shriftii]